VRVVFAGTPDVALPALEAIAASRHDLVGVVTRPDARAGRGRQLAASPVGRRAEELGVPVLKPEHPREPDFQAALARLAPDCCPVVAYGALLPESALAIPVHGWVNLHFSVLPHWRGAAPVQHSIWAGDEVTGATTFRIVKELDAGPTYGLMTQTIRPDDTAGTLLATLAEGGAGLLVATLDGIEDGSLEARPQQEEGVSYAPKVLVEDARVDWAAPALAVDRQVRACTPAPGAWTTFEGERLKLGPVIPVDPDAGQGQGGQGKGGQGKGGHRLPPGVLEVTRNAVHVGTGTGPVRLGAVKPFGKKQMPAADWARGVSFPDHAVLGG
jgi:methionyl-tRNA formyltransferase